jgi:hypothetical protein
MTLPRPTLARIRPGRAPTRGRVDEMVGLRRARQRHDHIHLAITDGELLERNEAVHGLDRLPERVVPHRRAEGGEAPRTGRPDAAEPDDEHGHLIELAHLPPQGPRARVLVGAQPRQVLRSGEHAEHRELGERSPWTPAVVEKTTRWSASGARPASRTCAASGRRGHDPPQPRIGRDRARERRRIDIRDAEQGVGRVDQLLEAALLAGVRRKAGSPDQSAGAAHRRKQVGLADHLDARFELLDQPTELLRSGTAATARSVRTA